MLLTVVGPLIVGVFVALDKIWYIEKCSHCGYERDVICNRFLATDLDCQVVNDFGSLPERSDDNKFSNCPHGDYSRKRKQRWIGMLIPVDYSHRGTERLSE
jgi:hypothetical protein